jgi:hypothetical protein
VPLASGASSRGLVVSSMDKLFRRLIGKRSSYSRLTLLSLVLVRQIYRDYPLLASHVKGLPIL